MIKTMLGDFTKGEKVAIVMYGPCGQEYVYKGIVHGKRECMGREYLVVETEDGYLYDVSPYHGTHVVQGPEVDSLVEKSYEKRHRAMEEYLEKEEEAEECEEIENQMEYDNYYQEPRKYTRI